MTWLEEMNRPALAIGPAVNPEIQIMQRRLLDLFYAHKAYLAAKPVAFLEDLLHQTETQRSSADFTVRTAAEMNRAACVLLLENTQIPTDH